MVREAGFRAADLATDLAQDMIWPQVKEQQRPSPEGRSATLGLGMNGSGLYMYPLVSGTLVGG